MPKITKAEYLSLKEQGMNDAAIARKFKITRQSVHYLGHRFGLPSGAKLNKITPAINLKDDGLLSYAKAMRSSGDMDSRLAAILIYHSVIRSVIDDLVNALRHLSSISTLDRSSGKITINVKREDFPGNTQQQIKTLGLFDFPEKEVLQEKMECFFEKVHQLTRQIGIKSKEDLNDLLENECCSIFKEAEEILDKYCGLMGLLQNILSDDGQKAEAGSKSVLSS